MPALPLLLVPGLMCDHTVWDPVIPGLDARVQTIVVDHGNADDLTGMAERLLASTPARFAIAGHSMGGRVALEVARLAPERLQGLALLDTGCRARAGGSVGEEEARKRQALLDVARTQSVRAMAQVWVQGMVHPRRLSDAPLIESIVAMFERKSADIFARQIRALLNRPDATPVLHCVRVPTLVLCGREDSWAPVSQHQEIVDLIPAGYTRLEVVADAGHMSPMEQPVAVAKALNKWLARI